jgi:UDP-N-acetylglucosamine--N-acetylmuramyl-(pentapeptide) pyrophosphoryl-undecaprenol N-acetylglucosamine transferase
MLAAGGTGGHLFPAFALAQELGRRGVVVDLMTDMRAQKYGADFPARTVYRIPSATLAERSPRAVAGTAWTLTRGIAAAVRLLGTTRPGAVVGFGGYPTFPPLIAAWLRRIPTIVHEQNAVLGRANRMLAPRARAIATSFEPTGFVAGPLLAKGRLTGNPVRDQVITWSQQAYRGPDDQGPFHLLVFGGSQGARVFSEIVPAAVALLPDPVRANLFIVQQARAEDLASVEATYRASGIRAHVSTFFSNLPEEMSKAHLVIGRAGASTVAELMAIGRPSLLVPLPHALDNDQLANATRLAQAGGCWCLEQKTLTPERLAAELSRLFSEPQVLTDAAAAAKRLGRPDAVARLADLVEEQMGLRARRA